MYYNKYFKIKDEEDIRKALRLLLKGQDINKAAEETGLSASSIYRYRCKGNDTCPTLRTLLYILNYSGIKCTIKVFTTDGKMYIGMNGLMKIMDETVKTMPVSYKNQLFNQGLKYISDEINADNLIKMGKWYNWEIVILDDIRWESFNGRKRQYTTTSTTVTSSTTEIVYDEPAELLVVDETTNIVEPVETEEFDLGRELSRFLIGTDKDMYNRFLKEVIYTKLVSYIRNTDKKERNIHLLNQLIGILESSDDETISHDVELIKMCM